MNCRVPVRTLEEEPALPRQPHIRAGYFFAVLAAVLWASSGIASKFLFNNGITAHGLVQMRCTLASSFLFFWLFTSNRSLLLIDRRDLPYFISLGLELGAVQYTYLFAISKINVAMAVLIQYQAPVFVVLYTMLILRARLPAVVFIALMGLIPGCYLVVGAYNLDLLNMNRAGVLAALCSAVLFACYTVLSARGMRRYDPRTVVFFGLLFSAVIWNILHPPLAAFLSLSGIAQWGCVLFVGIVGTVIAFTCYNQAIFRIGAVRTSITATLEPITAGFMAWILLSETMESRQILGALLVIASVIVLQAKGSRR